MLKSSIRKSFGIIQLSVEAYYSGDLVFPEVWKISLWSMVGIVYLKKEGKKKEESEAQTAEINEDSEKIY